jgi:hypothetical protein
LKKFFSLLLVTLMSAAVLAGCGTDQGNNTTDGTGNGTAGSAVTDRPSTTDGSDVLTPDPDTDRTDVPGTAAGSANVTGTAGRTDGAVTDAGNSRTAGLSAKQPDHVRGATYEQMLRNGYVHDRDGDLYDYENAVTPGTIY